MDNQTEIELSEIEKAKKLIADEGERIVKEAGKEFSEFLEEWSKKHGVKLQVSGSFSGEILNTQIEIILNK